MRTVFADTFYFLALLAREQRHADAIAASRDSTLCLVTTEYVLVEFGDAYCDPTDRPDFVALYHLLVKHPRIRIIPSGPDLIRRGVDFFERRPDKEVVTNGLHFFHRHGRSWNPRSPHGRP